MRNILILKSWQIFLLLYFLPVIQLITGNIIEIHNFTIGSFLSYFLYFFWILQLCRVFNVDGIKNFRIAIFLLSIVCYFLIPTYSIIWHINKYSENPLLYFIGGLLMLFFLCVLIFSWVILAKSISRVSARASKHKSSGFIVFLYFLFGPITIWLLQPQIIEVITLEKEGTKL